MFNATFFYSKLQSGEQLYTNLSDLVEDLANFSDSELTDDVSLTVLPQATFLTRSSRAIDVMDSPSEVSDAQTGNEQYCFTLFFPCC